MQRGQEVLFPALVVEEREFFYPKTFFPSVKPARFAKKFPPKRLPFSQRKPFFLIFCSDPDKTTDNQVEVAGRILTLKNECCPTRG